MSCWGTFSIRSFHVPDDESGTPQFINGDRIWRLDLRKEGYGGFGPHAEDFESPTLHGLAFSDNRSLIVSFLMRPNNSHLGQRGIAGSIELRIVRIDEKTGEAIATFTVPVASERVDVVAAPGSQVVVAEPRRVRLFDSIGRELLQRQLETASSRDSRSNPFSVLAASDGGSFAVQYGHDVHWIDSRTLAEIATTSGLVRAISDHVLAVHRRGQFPELDAVMGRLAAPGPCSGQFGSGAGAGSGGQSVQVTVLCNRAGKLLATLGGMSAQQGRVRFRIHGIEPGEDIFFGLLTDDGNAVMYADNMNQIGMYSISGWQAKSKWEFQPGGVDTLVPSRGGSIFAAADWRGSRIPALDLYGHLKLSSIQVYVPGRTKPIRLQSKGKLSVLDGIALSPSGRVLVLMASGNVEAYLTGVA